MKLYILLVFLFISTSAVARPSIPKSVFSIESIIRDGFLPMQTFLRQIKDQQPIAIRRNGFDIYTNENDLVLKAVWQISGENTYISYTSAVTGGAILIKYRNSDPKIAKQLLNFDTSLFRKKNDFEIYIPSLDIKISKEVVLEGHLGTFDFPGLRGYLKESRSELMATSKLWFSCLKCSGKALFVSSVENFDKTEVRFFSGFNQVEISPQVFFKLAGRRYLVSFKAKFKVLKDTFRSL